LEDFNQLPQAPYKVDVRAEGAGHVEGVDGRALGLYAMELGAGRKTAQDQLDLGVGVNLRVHRGQKVSAGDILLTVHSANPDIPALPNGWCRLADREVSPDPWLLDELD
jgi:pyrimidine-nucleoside phosphorylase